MLTIKIVVLLFTAFLKGPDGTTHGAVLQPQAFQTMEDCEKVRTKFEADLKVMKDDNIVAYRVQCVDNTMPIVGNQLVSR